MKGIKTNSRDLLFLRDDAIDNVKGDDFHHISIARSIESIIDQSSPPLTIGLFASWGAGKSGIAQILKGSLAKRKRVAFIEFDVWKYEDEASLRRQFLYTLHRQLEEQGLLGRAKLSELLDGSVSQKVNDGLSIDYAELGKLSVLSLVIILVALFADSKLLFGVVSISAIIAAVGFDRIMNAGLSVFKNKEKIVTKSRLTASDEFEILFQTLIDDCSAEKIVVVVDNLDRATEENAVRILSTIKSFLEYGKCVYLIPCDEDALKKHLGRVFNYSDVDDNEKVRNADEFLRKFFNAYMRIPRFIDADLQDFTEKFLLKTNFQSRYNNIQNLATVITSAYRDNPRQIKQFINIFLSHFLLADEREECNDLPRGEITNNPEFLAKILIIRQKWPKAYEQILKGETVAEASKDQNYLDFLESSSLAEEPLNIKSFLYFKLSKRATDLPTGLAEVLETAIEDAKIEDVKNFVTQAQAEKDHAKQLNQFFLALLEDASRMNRGQVLVNIINSIGAVWSTQIITLSNAVTERVLKSIKDKTYGRDLMAIDEEFVSYCISNSSQNSQKSAIANRYLDAIDSGEERTLTSSENVLKVLKFISTNQLLFVSSSIKAKLNKVLIPYVQDFESMQFIGQHALIELFDPSFLMELASKITRGDINEENSMYDVKSNILHRSPAVDSATLDKYLDANSLLAHEALQVPEHNKNLQVVLPAMLQVLHEKKPLIQASETTRIAIDTLTQGMRSGGNQQYRILILKLLLLLNDVASDTQKSDIKAILNDYVRSNAASATRELIDDPYTQNLNLFDGIRNPLEDRAVNDLDFASLIWDFGDDDAKTSLIERLLTHNSSLGLQFLDIHLDANDIPNKQGLVNGLLRLAKGVSQVEKPKYFERLVRIKAGGFKDAKEELTSQIVELACRADAASQILARETLKSSRSFISKRLRKQACLSILDWLEQQGKLTHVFIPAINMLFDNFDVLGGEEAKRLYRVIFSQWILQEADPQEILRSKELALDGVSKRELSEYLSGLEEKAQRQPHLKNEIEELKDYMGSKE